MYCGTSNLVGVKMVTPSNNFDPAIFWCLEHSAGGIISPEKVVLRIENLLEKNQFTLTTKDLEQISKTNKQAKWNRNVRNRMRRLKQDGIIAHIGPNQYCEPRDMDEKFRINHEVAWKKCAEIALFHLENHIPLVSNETYNIFVRSIGSDSIFLTKTTKNYHQLPSMEYYNGQVSTFSLNPPWIEKAAASASSADAIAAASRFFSAAAAASAALRSTPSSSRKMPNMWAAVRLISLV